jgi:Holliday junction resolvase RusA-like endonuclease
LKRLPSFGEPISFTIPLPPRPKERARTFFNERALASAFMTANGDVTRFMALVKRRDGDGDLVVMKTMTPEATRVFEKSVAVFASRAMAEHRRTALDCPVHLDIVFRVLGEDDTWPTAPGDGDLDNMEKALLDGMNGIVYVDDRLVVSKKSEKTCGAQNLIEVTARMAS